MKDQERYRVKLESSNPHYKPYYYGGVWLEIFDGGSDQWLYVAKSGSTYVFIEIIDFAAYGGSDVPQQWCGEVASVDLASVDPETAASAVRSCGSENDPPDLQTEVGRYALAEMLFSYGAKSPLWGDCAGRVRDGASDSSKDFLSLRAQARKEAEAMLEDEARNEVLDSKIVNAIGQTAREFAQGTGGLWDSLRRIKDAGENATPEQKLVLKMYGNAGQTLGAGPVPDDLRKQDESSIQFGTLRPDGSLIDVKYVKYKDIARCPFSIMAPEHYRQDGTCKCNDAEHRAMMIREWEYTEEDFRARGIEI